jgi:hypothetical protein
LLRFAANASVLLLAGYVLGSATFAGHKAVDARKDRDSIERGFLEVLVLCCLISPLSWSHYYTWLLLPIAFGLRVEASGAHGRFARGLACLAVVLLVPPVLIFHVTGSSFADWLYVHIAVSHITIGAVVLLLLLLRGDRPPASGRSGWAPEPLRD